ncbi:MAG TPA: ABC transporter substrate-binding protein [Candidatus Nitrosocosmicus sp.]|jgi:peptide/nickel transport system substrate-binding protein|nr:ABC transporter substrate-binding protein [Candidatus Nitrosocosmicus sp.]
MIMPRPRLRALGLALVSALLVGLGAPAESQTPRKGGVLQTLLIEDPPGLLAHESATVSNVWPMSPCYSNLVLFHPLKPLESADTVIPELAERWSWQDNYRNLVFFLRKNVKWHDGKPLTSRDVKYTFDVAREAPEAPVKFRLSARKEWWANVEAIEAPETHTVVFRLKRPQPSLLLMLASGYSPIYPAHVPLGELRQKCMGTGPFRFKEWQRGQSVELERNPDYFIPDRPYLDGIRYTVITERGTRLAALQAGRLDAFVPLEMTRAMAEAAKKSAPSLIITEVGQNGSDNVVLNHKRPPFDNPAVRRAVSLAMDRHGYVQSVRHGGAVVGAGLMPKPLGFWGLSDPDLKTLPGYRNSATDKAEARRLLAGAGFGPGGKPLRVELATRTLSIYLDVASFVADQLHQVGIESTVKQMDSAAWFPALARRDFQIAANLTAGGFDDPDAYFVENYKCGSSRNYTDYCNEETDRLIDQQSQELDRTKRLRLVLDIQKRLEADVARPMLGWRKEYFAHYPHVKNLVPHNALYNYGRMQDVWLDR